MLRISIAVVLLTSLAFSNIYKEKPYGFYQGKDITKKEQEEQENNSTIDKQAQTKPNKEIRIPQDLPMLSVPELKELMEQKANVAIQNPDNKNALREYLLVQKYITLQSEKFAHAVGQLTIEDDELNFASEIPGSGQTNKIFSALDNEEANRAIDKHIDNIAFLIIWNNKSEKLFKQQMNEFNIWKTNTLEPNIKKRSKVVNINADEKPMVLQAYEVQKIFPAIFILHKNDNGNVTHLKVGSKFMNSNAIHSALKKFVKKIEDGEKSY